YGIFLALHGWADLVEQRPSKGAAPPFKRPISKWPAPSPLAAPPLGQQNALVPPFCGPKIGGGQIQVRYVSTSCRPTAVQPGESTHQYWCRTSNPMSPANQNGAVIGVGLPSSATEIFYSRLKRKNLACSEKSELV